MFYITQSGQIYSGDVQNNDRQLTDEEVLLLKSRKFSILNNKVVDVETVAGFSQKQRIHELNNEIEEIYKQLNEYDLKSIRALREGGELEDGISYLDFYQSKINNLREQLQSLISEKAIVENELQNLMEATNDIIN